MTAAITAGDLAALVGSILSFVLVIGLLYALVALTRTLRILRTSVEELRRETVPLLGELRGTVGQANAELSRVDVLLDSAQSITATVDSASRLAYLVFSNPVIKILALGAGTGRAARRFRRRPD